MKININYKLQLQCIIYDSVFFYDSVTYKT